MASSILVEDPLLVSAPRKMLDAGILDSAEIIQEAGIFDTAEIIEEEDTDTQEEDEEEQVQEETQVAVSNPNEIARKYQLEVLEQALKKNTLVYLETGCGKTLIAVLLIKEICNQIRVGGQKGIVIFLAPTVPLVLQQYEVIAINIDTKVGHYYGAKGVDDWTIQTWADEINKHEVLVMTPQILLDILRHGFLKLDVVKLIIFDECHHTQGNHPYAKIMREYYQTSLDKPKIFGMTASPVIKKGVSSSHDCMDQISQLEHILAAQVYTLEDKSELELFVPTPNHKTVCYNPSVFNHNGVKLKLATIREKYETLQECEGKLLQSQFKDYEDLIENTRKELRSMHRNIEYCLENLGLFCAFKAVQVFIERCKIHISMELHADTIQSTKSGFLEEALQILKHELPNGMDKFYDMQKDSVRQGLLTPKVYVLLQHLLSYGEDVHCIIFVERVIAAAVISSMIKELHCFSTIKSEYLAGGTGVLSRKNQQSILDLFCAGKVHVLVTTNVTEEGIDVQGCRCIIRFDLPNTVRSYIQSRGRARKPNSDYVVLLERNNEKQLNMLFDVIRSEESMRDTSLKRDNIIYTPKPCNNDDEKINPFRVLSTGATINCDSSINFIHKYCAKLPGDKYYSPRPEFFFRTGEGKENLHICILRLPSNAPFQEVISPPTYKLLLAKQLACLQACKKLHEVGALDDYLLPIIEAESEDEEIINSKKNSTTGAGTTKRKELHITSKAKALSGCWSKEVNGVTLQVYKLVFSSEENERGVYSDFALLIEATLDKDVANTEMDLYLTAGRVVRSRFVPCGKMQMDSIQVEDAKAFHEILFTGIFSKLVVRAKKANESVVTKKNILGTKIMEGEWVSSNMYFLLPLEPEENNVCHNMVNIDWKCIHQCADIGRSLKDATMRSEIGENDFGSIYLANGPLPVSELIEKTVLTLHTGKIYCVTNILHDITAESPFPDPAKYASYCDYFENKYGKKLNFLKQPFLQVKQSHRPHNLLTRYVEKSKGKECIVKVEPNYIELPPELCLCLGVPSSVIRSLYLVPSVMHRMNTLMLASQLREEIQESSSCPFIPATLIMQALTTLRCLESFSFERLELLGDSVLKYAVSCHFFLKYDKKHEGQLTAHRSSVVRNSTLHALATSRKLPGYIRDEPFDPSRWVAPGTHCKRIVPCCCDAKIFEESVKGIVDMEQKVVKIGKTCDKGHRWMCSKTVADCVEALIGSYLVGGGLTAALKFMRWMNIPVACEGGLVNSAFEHASIHSNILKGINIHGLESQLKYVFHNKALLVEAITHASQHDSEGGGCYQRLEFLGDSVLDFLITRHLYEAHPDLAPGVLTDLRSAAVNNDNFAHVSVKYNLQQYLRHGSGVLLGQITGFVKAVQQCKGAKGVKAPKVLGDLVESIAGAILVDSRFNVEKVWEVMKPLLSPIVTPETLLLHPVREVSELCHLKGYPIVWKKSTQQGKLGKLSVATVEVVLEENTIVGKGCGISQKSAKEEAAQNILLQMKQHGIHHPRRGSKNNVKHPDSEVGGTTEHSVHEITSPRVTDTTCNTESEINISLELVRKKSMVIDTPVNSLIPEDLISDEKDQDQLCQKSNHIHSLQAEVDRIREPMTKAFDYTMIVNASKRKLEPSQAREFPVKKAKISRASVNSETLQDLCHGKKDDIVVDDAVGVYDKDLGYNVLKNSSVLEEDNNQAENKADSDDSTTIAKKVTSKSQTVAINLSMHKGGPRTNLYELCKKMMWRRPEFLLEQSVKPHIARFAFRVVVDIPDREQVSVQGEQRSDKKSAMDSAALLMLLELKKQGLCSMRR